MEPKTRTRGLPQLLNFEPYSDVGNIPRPAFLSSSDLYATTQLKRELFKDAFNASDKNPRDHPIAAQGNRRVLKDAQQEHDVVVLSLFPVVPLIFLFYSLSLSLSPLVYAILILLFFLGRFESQTMGFQISSTSSSEDKDLRFYQMLARRRHMEAERHLSVQEHIHVVLLLIFCHGVELLLNCLRARDWLLPQRTRESRLKLLKGGL